MTCDGDKYFNFQHFTSNIGISWGEHQSLQINRMMTRWNPKNDKNISNTRRNLN